MESTKGLENVTRVRRCPSCGGSGVRRLTGNAESEVSCKTCLGNGQVLYIVRRLAPGGRR